LKSITDDVSVFEHCLGREPRYEHGYCVDDAARAIVVLARSIHPDGDVEYLIRRYAAFLGNAQHSDGRIVNRRDVAGRWQGEPSTDDHWGRAIWAWGTLMRSSRDPDEAAIAFERFAISAKLRSPNLRSMAFAALGASEVLQVLPGNRIALDLLEDCLALVAIPPLSRWPWPEPRLTYANAVIPEVLMLGGMHLRRNHFVRWGKLLLDWLFDVQTLGGKLSPIPNNGWARGEMLPGFDQQPIEVAALVDACTTAYDITSDPIWSKRLHMGLRWFEGDNDRGVEMCDPETGAGFDGLTEEGRNANCGAESTLAYLSVKQRASVFADAPS